MGFCILIQILLWGYKYSMKAIEGWYVLILTILLACEQPLKELMNSHHFEDHIYVI